MEDIDPTGETEDNPNGATSFRLRIAGQIEIREDRYALKEKVLSYLNTKERVESTRAYLSRLLGGIQFQTQPKTPLLHLERRTLNQKLIAGTEGWYPLNGPADMYPIALYFQVDARDAAQLEDEIERRYHDILWAHDTIPNKCRRLEREGFKIEESPSDEFLRMRKEIIKDIITYVEYNVVGKYMSGKIKKMQSLLEKAHEMKEKYKLKWLSDLEILTVMVGPGEEEVSHPLRIWNGHYADILWCLNLTQKEYETNICTVKSEPLQTPKDANESRDEIIYDEGRKETDVSPPPEGAEGFDPDMTSTPGISMQFILAHKWIQDQMKTDLDSSRRMMLKKCYYNLQGRTCPISYLTKEDFEGHYSACHLQDVGEQEKSPPTANLWLNGVPMESKDRLRKRMELVGQLPYSGQLMNGNLLWKCNRTKSSSCRKQWPNKICVLHHLHMVHQQEYDKLPPEDLKIGTDVHLVELQMDENLELILPLECSDWYNQSGLDNRIEQEVDFFFKPASKSRLFQDEDLEEEDVVPITPINGTGPDLLETQGEGRRKGLTQIFPPTQGAKPRDRSALTYKYCPRNVCFFKYQTEQQLKEHLNTAHLAQKKVQFEEFGVYSDSPKGVSPTSKAPLKENQPRKEKPSSQDEGNSSLEEGGEDKENEGSRDPPGSDDDEEWIRCPLFGTALRGTTKKCRKYFLKDSIANRIWFLHMERHDISAEDDSDSDHDDNGGGAEATPDRDTAQRFSGNLDAPRDPRRAVFETMDQIDPTNDSFLSSDMPTAELSVADTLKLMTDSNKRIMGNLVDILSKPPEERRNQTMEVGQELQRLNEKVDKAVSKLIQKETVSSQTEESIVPVPASFREHTNTSINLKELSLVTSFNPVDHPNPEERAGALIDFLRNFLEYCQSKRFTLATCENVLLKLLKGQGEQTLNTFQRYFQDKYKACPSLPRKVKFLLDTYAPDLTPQSALRALPKLRKQTGESHTSFANKLYRLCTIASIGIKKEQRAQWLMHNSKSYFMEQLSNYDRKRVETRDREQNSKSLPDLDIIQASLFLLAEESKDRFYSKGREPVIGRDKNHKVELKNKSPPKKAYGKSRNPKRDLPKAAQVKETKKKVTYTKGAAGKPQPQVDIKTRLQDAGVSSDQCLKCGQDGHRYSNKMCILSSAKFADNKCPSCKRGLHIVQNCPRTPFMEQKPQRFFKASPGKAAKAKEESPIIYCNSC